MRGDAGTTYRFIAALVEALAAGGVRDACLAPGSRSAPLALLLDRHPSIRVWTHLDERAAAFFGLGLARARRAPVVLVATSGTAAANFLPAVIEARQARVPLVVLTADRPPELRDAGAAQTIDQLRLYGAYAKWWHEVALPEAGEDALRYAWGVGARAVLASRTSPAGPVHLNVPLREPLVPEPGALPAFEERRAAAIDIPNPRPPNPAAVASLASELAATERGLIVSGPQDDPDLPAALTRLAAVTGYPVLADPLSLVRFGPHDRSLVVDAYDAFLRNARLAAELRPEVVLRIGDTPISKPLLEHLAGHRGAHQVLLPGDAPWNDPDFVARTALLGDARLACVALADAAEAHRARGAGPWAARWRAIDARAGEALDSWLADLGEPFEARAIADLASLLPDGATLVAGNSMPVRDLDAFVRGSSRAIRPLANRGASGIDGVVSTALGASASGAPLALAIGDVSFIHDLGGLLAARAHRLRATILLLHNDGGGIFSFLPVARHGESFERLFGTPHGLDLSAVRDLFGIAFERTTSAEEARASLAAALERDGVTVVEVRTDRGRNVVLHREAWAAVSRAVAAVPA